MKNVTHNGSVSVVAVLVLRRKVKSAKLVIDEDESTTDSQFAFSRGLTNNSSVIQEHFNNRFEKVRIFARKVAHQCLGCLVTGSCITLCCTQFYTHFKVRLSLQLYFPLNVTGMLL